MVIVCRGTRFCHLSLLTTKDLVLAELVKFIIEMKVQHSDRQIRKIRFDNAQEFISATMKSFLVSRMPIPKMDRRKRRSSECSKLHARS